MTKNEAVFTKDTTNKTITVVRPFDAHQQQVWDAWTKSEILDQWWAPKPFTSKTKEMDFREGGHWHYCMVSPEGEEFWGVVKYKTVDPISRYTAVDTFSDEEGNPNNELPSMHWDVKFSASGDTTSVSILISFNKAEDMDTILKMGFEEGFKMGLGNLDEYLAGQ